MNRKQKDKIKGWLENIRGKEPLAVIMGGSTNGLSFARSLGRRRIPTLLLESERQIGTYTRYGKVVILPPADECPADWLDFLDFVGAKLEPPGVLFPTSDLHCVFVSERSEALRRYFRFVVPKSDTLEQIVNKRIQYRIAKEMGIPIPRTYFPESLIDVRSLAKDMPYPCILKPYKSHLARKKIPKKVVVIHSRDELIPAYSQIATSDVDFMIQEIIPGPDSCLFGYLAFWDDNGHERNWLTKRKLRQNPPLYGDGSLQITVHEPEIAELSRRLLSGLDYRGFVGTEFKFDDRDQTFRLMEINPRTVSGNQLAISAGVDFPWIGHRYLTGSHTTAAPAEPFRIGVKYFNEEWDVKAYLALRKSRELTFGRWLRSVCGSKAKAIGAWDDPLPLIVLLGRFLRAFLRGMKLSSGKRAKEGN